MEQGPKYRNTPEYERAEGTLLLNMHQGAYRNVDFVPIEAYERIIDQLGDLKGKRIAEIGAGLVRMEDGATTPYERALADKGATLIPVDIQGPAVTTWNLAKAQDSLKVTPVQADARSLPFEDASIDGCVSINMINMPPSKSVEDMHVFVYQFLKEVFRMLKKDGFVILSSFGYTKYIRKDGSSENNNEIPENQKITLLEVAQVANMIGFTHIEELALDAKKLAFRKIINKELEKFDGKKTESSETFGLYLKK